MKTILLLGAGKSATFLIEYLLENAPKNHWKFLLVDADSTVAKQKAGGSPWCEGIGLDITDSDARKQLIKQADLVISLLPPKFHILVALDCLEQGRHLFTASYIDEDVRKLQSQIQKKGLLFLYEMGLDPGIDHMSAMELIDRIHGAGAKVVSFISHCGGLVSKKSDNNPWHYKISWNPANVVHAGKQGAHYLLNNKEVYLTHPELFSVNRLAKIQLAEELAWYPNRDSISYSKLYGVESAETFIRTTLRHSNFMVGWQKLIQLQLTDENPILPAKNTSIANFFHQILEEKKIGSKVVDTLLQDTLVKNLFSTLGFFDSHTTLLKNEYTPALFLQECLERRLKMDPADCDRVVMQHELIFEKDGKRKKLISTLDIEGIDSTHTAMAKTVGLPLALATKHFLNDEIPLRGLQIPTTKGIYHLILPDLANQGIRFNEVELDLLD